jgi:hypothetical protein
MILNCIIINAIVSYGISIVFAALFLFSEWLGRNKKIKESDVYTFIHNLLKTSAKREK